LQGGFVVCVRYALIATEFVCVVGRIFQYFSACSGNGRILAGTAQQEEWRLMPATSRIKQLGVA
jgi:hypothetical protein